MLTDAEEIFVLAKWTRQCQPVERIHIQNKNELQIFFPHILGGCFFFNSTTGQQPELIPGQGQQVLLVSGTHTMIENV